MEGPIDESSEVERKYAEELSNHAKLHPEVKEDVEAAKVAASTKDIEPDCASTAAKDLDIEIEYMARSTKMSPLKDDKVERLYQELYAKFSDAGYDARSLYSQCNVVVLACAYFDSTC
jgi:hypothetical protein